MDVTCPRCLLEFSAETPLVQPFAPPVPTSFQVRVVSPSLYTRVQPSQHADPVVQPSEDGLLHAGDVIECIDEVPGDDPYNDGRNLWYVTHQNHYIWTGGSVRM